MKITNNRLPATPDISASGREEIYALFPSNDSLHPPQTFRRCSIFHPRLLPSVGIAPTIAAAHDLRHAYSAAMVQYGPDDTASTHAGLSRARKYRH